MRSDRGQALVFAAVLVALAATALVGIKGLGDLLVESDRDQRAGEAAVAAAGAAVGDLLLAESVRRGGELDRAGTAVFAASQSVAEAAREAAGAAARLQGRADPSEVTVQAFGLEIEVHVTLAGRQHIALLEPPP